MNYWLFKSEPGDYSIEDLQKDKTTLWEGVRNYQARNFMRDQCKTGDLILFYHSSCRPAGVAGLAVVTNQARPDPSQFAKNGPYYDPKATKEKPRWQCVEVGFEEKFDRLVGLAEIKQNPKLKNTLLVQKGSRLSIQPVKKAEFEEIIKMCNCRS